MPYAAERLTAATGRVHRLRSRRQVERARRARRASSGAIWVRFAPTEAGRPAVGYAIGRHAGNAVARNRLRRRLRAAVADLAPTLPAGDYLIGASAHASTLTFSQLSAAVATALRAAAAR